LKRKTLGPAGGAAKKRGDGSRSRRESSPLRRLDLEKVDQRKRGEKKRGARAPLLFLERAKTGFTVILVPRKQGEGPISCSFSRGKGRGKKEEWHSPLEGEKNRVSRFACAQEGEYVRRREKEERKKGNSAASLREKIESCLPAVSKKKVIRRVAS